MKIGILALQGNYQAHAKRLSELGVNWQWVRHPQDLVAIEGLILPGGESGVCLNLFQKNGLFSALQAFQKPILGTCAGAILLAKTVQSSIPQLSLAHIAITITRNAYGRQLASHIVTGTWATNSVLHPLEMVFIRAPIIQTLDDLDVQILATDTKGHVVAVQHNQYIATCFHPELSTDPIVHQYFITLLSKSALLSHA